MACSNGRAYCTGLRRWLTRQQRDRTCPTRGRWVSDWEECVSNRPRCNRPTLYYTIAEMQPSVQIIYPIYPEKASTRLRSVRITRLQGTRIFIIRKCYTFAMVCQMWRNTTPTKSLTFGINVFEKRERKKNVWNSFRRMLNRTIAFFLNFGTILVVGNYTHP